MATKSWIGTAAPYQERYTATIGGTWVLGDTISVTLAGRTLVLTTGALTTAAAQCVSLKEAWNSTTFTDSCSCMPIAGGAVILEMSEWTATSTATTVVFTLDTGGVSGGAITIARTTAGSGTVSIAHTATFATGPNFWDNLLNWDNLVELPISTNDILIDRPVSILYGLSQSAVILASLTIGEKFTAASYIGLPVRNSIGYEEYRASRLAIGATLFTDYGTSGRIRLDFAGNATTAVMYGSTIDWIGTNAANIWRVFGGDLSIARYLGELATVATLTITDGVVTCGIGATLTNVTKNAGTLTVASSTTTLISLAGTTEILGGTHTALTVGGGTCNVRGASVLTLLRQMGGTVVLEPAVAWTTIDKSAGTLTIASGGTTLTSDGGITRVLAGAITTLNCNGGSLYLSGTGTIGTLNLKNCTVYFDSGTTAGITVTTMGVVGDVVFIDTAARVTITNPPTAYNGRLTYKPAK